MLKDTKIYPETPNLIFCEGADAKYFLVWFLDHAKQQTPAFSCFRVYDFGGITALTQYLRNIARTDDFKKIVKSLCIIRDAEKDASGACQSILGALRDNKFAVPDGPFTIKKDSASNYPHIVTGFLLFPSCSAKLENGTLEDLCLRMLAKPDFDVILADADSALSRYSAQLPRLHKNRLHTCFSLTNEYVSLKIGEATKARAFSFQGKEMNALKSFLMQMAESS